MIDFRGDVTVNATSTSLAVIDVRDTRLVAVAIKNQDVTQTLSVTLRRRCHPADDFAEGNIFEELTDIPPGTQRAVDVDVGVQWDLEVVGIASGAGLTATLTVKPDRGRRP